MTTQSTAQVSPATAQAVPSAKASHTHEALCHVLAAPGLVIPFGNIVGPLVFWLMKKSEKPAVDVHGKESLNFQISMTIWTLICVASMLVVVGFFLTPLAILVNIIFTVIASVKASNGALYRYPLTIRFIK